MNFLKKNIIYIVLILLLAAITFIPNFGSFIKEQIFLKPTLKQVENQLTISEDEYDIQLKGINVPSTNLSNFRNKILFLNFWGTWCAPCREEWPTIQKLYESQKDKTSFVLIAMQDKEDSVLKFLKENNYTVPVYIAESPISEKLLPISFPTTFVIGRDGRIYKKEDHSIDWNSTSIHDFFKKISK